MTLHPPIVLQIASRYHRWALTQRTHDWERLGHYLLIVTQETSYDALQECCLTTLSPRIPWAHLQLAVADARHRHLATPIALPICHQQHL